VRGIWVHDGFAEIQAGSETIRAIARPAARQTTTLRLVKPLASALSGSWLIMAISARKALAPGTMINTAGTDKVMRADRTRWDAHAAIRPTAVVARVAHNKGFAPASIADSRPRLATAPIPEHHSATRMGVLKVTANPSTPR